MVKKDFDLRVWFNDEVFSSKPKTNVIEITVDPTDDWLKKITEKLNFVIRISADQTYSRKCLINQVKICKSKKLFK